MRTTLAISIFCLLGCAHKPNPVVVSGEVLVSMADVFVGVAAAMDAAVDNGIIDQDQYNTWARFGRKFQALYPIALSLWQTARATSTIEAERAALEAVTALSVELFAWAKETQSWKR